MRAVASLLEQAGLDKADGRPLYRYPLAANCVDALQQTLPLRLAAGHAHPATAAGFVFWAAEYIRARFPGGPLTWDFVFAGLRLPWDQKVGAHLVETGLAYWKRPVRVSEGGIRMYLYSLMAEGGLPEALLQQKGLYRRVVMGLLREIEMNGLHQLDLPLDAVAQRWVEQLPQTFRSEDCVSLLGNLTLALARLRHSIPDDLAGGAAEQWLERHQPGWADSLPLRLSPSAREALIRPALLEERGLVEQPLGRLTQRRLRRDSAGRWHGFVELAEEGWLPAANLPEAEGLRLKLIPLGALEATGPTYSATPDSGGWLLRRFGGSGPAICPLSPEAPLVLGAFADGRARGEFSLDAGLPGTDEAPGLWRALEGETGAEAQELIPQPGSGRTRAGYLWLLVTSNARIETDEGIVLGPPEQAPGGLLRSLCGKGWISIGSQRLRIETGAANDGPEADLAVHGTVLRKWQLPGAEPIYIGQPSIWGRIGPVTPRRLPEDKLVWQPGRRLGGQVVIWKSKDESLASRRLVVLPADLTLDLKEVAAGTLELQADHVPDAWQLLLSAGDAEARGECRAGRAKISLSVPGVAPALVALQIYDPSLGQALTLQAAWPSLRGLIVDPDGNRLTVHTPLDEQGLRGWRAVVPDHSRGDLELRLDQERTVSLPVVGEISLAGFIPLVRAMLAQGGPDSEVRLRLIVGGAEGPRIEIRRYHEIARLDGDILSLGLSRDERLRRQEEPPAGVSPTGTMIHAVDLADPGNTQQEAATGVVNLRALLPDTVGPWLVQPRFDGRIQRAVAWAPVPLPPSSREERIAAYERDWNHLLEHPESEAWERQWQLMEAAGQGGDAGVLDQVQALGLVPAAAVALALRVRKTKIPNVLDLEVAAPLFWPTIPVSAVSQALAAEHKRQTDRMRALFDQADADANADEALALRIGSILTLRPDLSGHFGAALLAGELLHRMAPRILQCRIELIADPRSRLADLAQEAAKRFDRLPTGVAGLQPLERPPAINFNSYAQPVIDAPLIAAEVATNLRRPQEPAEVMKLINLRLVDPGYFDAALPAAVALCLETKRI